MWAGASGELPIPAEVMRDVVAFATAGRAQEEREQIVKMIQQTARQWAEHNFASGCEVADMLVQRLDFGPGVREALRFTFERWNGNGYPAGARGEAIPRAMRVVHLSHDMEAIGRLFSPAKALDAARERHALTVAADFIDLKSPNMAGHSRRCAELSAKAARLIGFSEDAVTTLRRAALVHDFGTTGAELDLGQARPAQSCGVRSGRASPDAHRADAAPLAGASGAQPGRVGAPREG